MQDYHQPDVMPIGPYTDVRIADAYPRDDERSRLDMYMPQATREIATPYSTYGVNPPREDIKYGRSSPTIAQDPFAEETQQQ